MGKFSAEPTKDFFIYMLTRDIPLERAIIDLIDNSVDGAKSQLKKAGRDFKDENAYNGFKINISFDVKEFSIEDNCGGFSKDAAENYAFKFGRPQEANIPQEEGTVGRFGVGMKRALFKIGDYFTVESRCNEDHFLVQEDVQNWRDESENWEFDFRDIDESIDEGISNFQHQEDGTYIKVEKLNEAVAQDFRLKSFEKRMINEIEKTLNYSIERGLKIYVNEIELKSNPIQLLVSSDLVPYFLEETINGVNVKIYTGVGEPDPNVAGWYIYCNDRMMVEKDKTNLTGWEGGKKFYDESGVQKYHNKVAMFRGLVFFTSSDPSLLPMTTTKWGIDVNSTLYKTVRIKMINAMKQVLSDLNKLDNADQRQNIVNNSSLVDIVAYNKEQKLSDEFIFPEVKKTNFKDNKARISYRVDRELLSLVKDHYNTSTSLDHWGYFLS